MKNISSVEAKSYMLLTTADRQIEGFTHGTDPVTSFEDSLFEAIFFHEGAVLPDIFTFISSAIASKQSDAGLMHLELAVEEGLVIPAFRYNCTSFSESLALIEEQGIQGVQEVPRIIAHRLDNAFEKNKTRKLINGANEISQVFAVRLLNGLKSFTMRASSQPIVEEVVITADFINKYGMKNEVIAAIENEHGELRRGTFYNILLSALNKISDSGKRIVHDSARDILSLSNKLCNKFS